MTYYKTQNSSEIHHFIPQNTGRQGWQVCLGVESMIIQCQHALRMEQRCWNCG